MRISNRTAVSRRLFASWLEKLEPRRVLATITVTSAGDAAAIDSGVTLREAILSINGGANFNADVVATGSYGTNDAIQFNIPGGGVQTIDVGGTGNGALPSLTKPVAIDGFSQPGASQNGLADGDNAAIMIELNGAAAGPNADGLSLTAGASSVKGLAINRFTGNGIKVAGSNNTIAGDFIGLNPAGSVALSNGQDGVLLVAGSSNNTVGGLTAAARNVISGNAGAGVHVVGALVSPSTNNIIEGNFIGVNAAGTGSTGLRPSGAHVGTAAGNDGAGIDIDGAVNSTIGGGGAGARNVVGLNLYGIALHNGAQNNLVQGNSVGVGADGVSTIGNVLQGIVLYSNGSSGGQANEPGIQNNTIGGTIAGAGNTVANNGAAGIAVFGNPLSLSGQQNTNNPLLGNLVFQNGRNNPTAELGIDLSTASTFPADDGVTANTSGGPHTGPNALQNFPVLASVSPGLTSTTIAGTLNSSPNTSFRIEFFSNPTASGSGHGEGKTYLGFTSVTTDGGGNGAFNAILPVAVGNGQYISATATDANNNTSEFSASIPTSNPAPTISSISPTGAPEGTNASLTVVGANFVNGAVVRLGGTVLATTYVSAGQLTALIPASLLADEGALPVTVQNLAPGGGIAGGVTFQVQESLLPDGTRGTANQRYISELYHDLLARAVDPAGLAFWAGAMAAGASRAAVVSGIVGSLEYRIHLTQSLFQTYLHRAADAAGLAGAVNILNTGGTQEEVSAILIGSDEYFAARGGGSTDGFINALFQDVFNRTPNANDLNGFRQYLTEGHSRTAAAAVALGSAEHQQVLADRWYAQYLERSPDTAGLNYAVNQLTHGVRDDQVIAQLASSDEFYSKTAP